MTAFLRSAPVLVVLCVSACATWHSGTKDNRVTWEPPSQGVIRNGVAAITIARAIWFSTNPTLPKVSELYWQQSMIATLSNGVWHVREKPLGHDAIGGGLEIDLNAKDAKVVGMFLTQ
jgi:hypothetical protein